MSLMNPGAMTEYDGSSNRSSRRSRGTIRVRDPAHGFFLAGSSIMDLNGIYGRVHQSHVCFLSNLFQRREVHLCYRHDTTGWLMALVEVTEAERKEWESSDDEYDPWKYGRRYREPCTMQWRLIDDAGVERFSHKGDTIIPGAGVRWKHVHLPTFVKKAEDEDEEAEEVVNKSSSDSDSEYEDARDSTEYEDARESLWPMLEDVGLGGEPQNNHGKENGKNQIVEAKEKEEDDEDELPWQVIALLDASVLEDLRFSSKCRDEKISRALKGMDVEQPPENTIGGFLEAEREKFLSLPGKNNTKDDNGDMGELGTTIGGEGWLYKVNSSERVVPIYTAPVIITDDNDNKACSSSDFASDDASSGKGASEESQRDGDVVDNDNNASPRKVGFRSRGDYIRIVEKHPDGRWLRLASTEKPLLDPPLRVGDTVFVSEGHYRGNKGRIKKPLDPDTRSFGVELVGYTGTGWIHISSLKRDGPNPNCQAARDAARRVKEEKIRKRREARERLEAARRLKLERIRQRRETREHLKETYGSMYEEFLPAYLMDASDEDEDLIWQVRFGRMDDDSDDDSSDDDGTEGGGYDSTYNGPLWIAATTTTTTDTGSSVEQTLFPVPMNNAVSLSVGVEKEDADLYDRPFEPRIEGEASEDKTLDDDDDDDAEGMESSDEEGNQQAPAVLNPLFNSHKNESSQFKESTTSDGDDEDSSSSVPVGSRVLIRGLENAKQYNGRIGTVITTANMNGRYGVRLDMQNDAKDEGGGECNKTLLVKSENFAVTATTTEGDDQLDDEVERAARVLNVSVDSIGLGKHLVDPSNGEEIVNSLLRAAERDNRPNQSTWENQASRMLKSDILDEARNSHARLLVAIEARDQSQDENAITAGSVAASINSMAPHSAVESGFLGERAKHAAVCAGSKSNFSVVESGLVSLRRILADEQWRLCCKRAKGGLVSNMLSPRKLEEAERFSDDDDANDCLCFRLTIVSALFESQKTADAAAAAEATANLYPNSAAALLWHSRCQVRSGHRTNGMQTLNRCVALGANKGTVGGLWAHSEAVKRARSLRRTLKCDIRAKDAYERGQFANAAKVYGEMMQEYDEYANDDQWGNAEALIARAACYRRARDLVSALADCDAALNMFPRYPRALFRRALCLLESQRPKEALAAFEQLLRVDRKWPNLLDWLIRSVAQARRLEANGGKPSGDGGGFDGKDPSMSNNEDYYAVLGVSTDATEAQLKRAYRLMSLKVHPDKKGGSSEAFQLVSTAYETLNDPEKRQLYDDGVDTNKKKKKKKKGDPYYDESSESEDEDGNKKKSLREEVERKYFPENFQFWPFGDPFIDKRRRQARKKKEEEQAKARKEFWNGKKQTHHHPWWHAGDDAWDL